jgi:hypothetical protein
MTFLWPRTTMTFPYVALRRWRSTSLSATESWSHSYIRCELAREGWNGWTSSPHRLDYWLGKSLWRGSDDSSDGWMTLQFCKWKCRHPSTHRPASCMTSLITSRLTMMLKSCKDLSLGEMRVPRYESSLVSFHSQLFQLSCHLSHWLYHCCFLDC